MESPQYGREEGAKFVTLAMDASVGATEGFQLCDVAVQMVAEQLLNGENMSEEERYFHCSDPVIVDGQETHEVDSVLCLVNTAMLSHQGKHSGKDSVLAKNGGLTGKAKKKILLALNHDGSEKLLKVLSDFHILCGLDKVLGNNDMDEVTRLVSKYAKGQKKGTSVNQSLRKTLQSVVGG